MSRAVASASCRISWSGANNGSKRSWSSLESLCAERNPSGTLGLEDQCMRAAVIGLHRSERATTTDIRYRERRRLVQGVRTVIDTPLPGQLAKINARAGRGRTRCAPRAAAQR